MRSNVNPINSNAINTWWPIVCGLLAMYVPTLYKLGFILWNTAKQGHAPMILLVILYLFWQKRSIFASVYAENAVRPEFIEGKTKITSLILGWSLLIFGLSLYVIGRSQGIMLFDVGSLIPILTGTLLIIVDKAAVKALWFPLLFIIFIIPLPDFIVDAVTGPLKQQVSHLAEAILYHIGYPIARSGVMLTVGQYQLLVADACSGLNSMFSLSALGLLYLYMMHHENWLRNGIIIASILPIAFFANIIRVIVLILVTYHFGDEAGQSFVHDFAGILLFIISLLFLFALDSVLGLISSKGTMK